MNVKTWLPLGVALVLGLGAFLFARNLKSSGGPDTSSSSKTVAVVIATREIGAGEDLTGENCRIGSVAVDSVPDRSFHTVAELKNRVAGIELLRGQSITENVLAPVGTGTGLQAVIPTGMRAISIEINEFSGVGGMLLPGCHVDLLATLPGETGGEMISRTVVQNVQVSAVGQRMVSQPEKKGEDAAVFRSVTLLVTPSEAEAVELACNSGRPRLVLRSSADKSDAPTAGVTSSNLRGSVARKNDPAYSNVKIIRGTVETEVRLSSGVIAEAKANTQSDGKAISGADTAPAAGGAH